MKRRDYDQTKKILEDWIAKSQEKGEKVSWEEDLTFLLESMKDRSYPDEEYLGEELLDYLTAKGDGGDYPEAVKLTCPSDPEENAYFLRLNQILKVESGSLGKWPSKRGLSVPGELLLHLALRKGREDAFEKFGGILSAGMRPEEEMDFVQGLIANDVVERAIYLSKQEDPDWTFDTRKFLNGPREDKAYSAEAENWHGLKEDKINDHGILFVFEDRKRLEKVLEELSKKATEVLGKEEALPLAFVLGTAADRKAYFEKVLQPLEKNSYASKEKIVEEKNEYAKARKDFLAQLDVVKGIQKELGEFQFKAIRMLSDWEAREKALADAKSVIEHHQTLIQDAETVRDGYAADRKELDDDMEKMSATIDEETAKLKDLEKEINENKAKVTEGYAKEEETLKSVSIVTKIFSKKKYDATVELAEQYHVAAGEASDLELKLAKDAKDLGKKMHELLDQQEQMEEKRNFFTEEISKRNKDVTAWKQIIAKSETEIEETEALLQEVKAEYEKLLEGVKKEGEQGKRVILDKPYLRKLFSQDEKEREKALAENPWVTPKYNAEREKLFLLASKLCREFVRSSHGMRENLITLEQYFGLRMGDDKKKIDFEALDMASLVPALYQTLLLLTPVVGMTADEAGEALKDVKKPGIFGRSIVDFGADDFAAQKALGILFRSRQVTFLNVNEKK